MSFYNGAVIDCKNADEWIVFIDEKVFSTKKDGSKTFDSVIFREIYRLIPEEFVSHEKIEELRKISLMKRELCILEYEGVMKYIGKCDVPRIDTTLDLKGKCTLENSIFFDNANYRDSVCMESAMCAWLAQTKAIYKFHKGKLNYQIANSIDCKQLVVNEKNNLDNFFNGVGG